MPLTKAVAAATAVFDLDSIGLLKMVKGLNGGVDPAGRDFGGQVLHP